MPSLTYPSTAVESGTLAVKIDVASLDTGSGMKDGKLRGKDFFNVKEAPYITFTSTKIFQTGPTTFEVDGGFTIRGVTRKEKLELDVSGKNGCGNIYVSRYYNWHPGSWKDAYSHGASYKLKADAPNDAIETLSKNLLVPPFEKLFADGTILEYEIDTEAIHTEAPGTIWVFYITANAENLGKVNEALQEAMGANPLGGQAVGSIVDFTAHRDLLVRTNATYK